MNFNAKKTGSFLLGLLLSGAAQAQTPAKLWSKSYGGTRSDILNAFTTRTDAGFVAVGTTTSTDGDVKGKLSGTTENDWWIVQFNDTGAIVRQRVIGSTGSDYLYAIRPLKKGGYIAAGFLSGNTRNFDTLSTRGGMDAAIVKLNDTLGVEWVRAYGGTGAEAFYDIQETPDHGLVVCGYTNSANGNITHKLNGSTDDWWLMTTDSAGNIISNKTYGGSGPATLLVQERAYSIQLDPRSGFVAAGVSSSNDGSLTGKGLGLNDIWVLRLDDTLGIVWNKTLGGSNQDAAANIIITADSNYALAGYTKSVDGQIHSPKGGGQNDIWVAKLRHSSGDTIWTRSYGGLQVDGPYGYCAIRNTIDEGFIVDVSSSSSDQDITAHIGGTSNTFSDAWIFKLDSTGRIQWDKNLGTTAIDNPSDIAQLPDGSYFFIGQSNGSGGDVGVNKGSNDIFIAKIAACPSYTYLHETICEGHPYSFGGVDRGTAGIYYDTLAMVSGCDSVIKLNLLVNPSVMTMLRDTICKGGTYVFNGETLSTAGLYRDTLVMAGSGCDSFIHFTLVVDSVLQPLITASGDVLSTGSYASYTWLDASGKPIPGATGATYTAAGSGSYRVAVTGANGCSDTSVVYNHKGTGIDETDPLAGLSLYPNPSTHTLYFSLPSVPAGATLTLSSAEGKIIYTTAIKEARGQIPLQQLAPGIYFIRISTEQGSILKKIIKE